MSEELERFFAPRAQYQASENGLTRYFLLEDHIAQLGQNAKSSSLRRSIGSFVEEERNKRRREHERWSEEQRREKERYVEERLTVMERWSRCEVQRSTAASLVKASAWWLTHASGNPVRAPGHASRIELGKRGWSIEFGANHFLIGRFVQAASRHFIEGFDLVRKGNLLNRLYFLQKLRKDVRGCVANYNYDVYEDYVPSRGQLVFGAQAIDIDDASNYVIDASGLSRYCFLPEKKSG